MSEFSAGLNVGSYLGLAAPARTPRRFPAGFLN
jgi:hypothetical protein